MASQPTPLLTYPQKYGFNAGLISAGGYVGEGFLDPPPKFHTSNLEEKGKKTYFQGKNN